MKSEWIKKLTFLVLPLCLIQCNNPSGGTYPTTNNQQKNTTSQQQNEANSYQTSTPEESASEEPVSVNYVWGCNQCGKVIYQTNKPDILNCPVGYTYNGGSGSSHNWYNYGKQGTEYYHCEYCLLGIQVEDEPEFCSSCCNSHMHAQAQTSAHTWVHE